MCVRIQQIIFNLQEYINLTCARNIRIKLLTTGIKPPFWIRTIRFFGRVCVNNDDINRRESSNRGQLKMSPANGTNVYTALCWRGGIRYSVWPDIYRGFDILVLCFSQRKEERFTLVVLRAWSLFDQENAVLPLQRATFFNLFFFFRCKIQLDCLFPKGNTYWINFKESKRNLFIWKNIYQKFCALFPPENCKIVISLECDHIYVITTHIREKEI